jgi:hypothetical protein
MEGSGFVALTDCICDVSGIPFRANYEYVQNNVVFMRPFGVL